MVDFETWKETEPQREREKSGIPGSVASVGVAHVPVDEGVGGSGGGRGGAHRVKVAGGGGGTATGVKVRVVHFELQYRNEH